MRFHDRTEAGQQLATRLLDAQLDAPVVLALPRGGVPVGVELAAALAAPLDVLVARKVGAPGHPELGIGAIAEGGGQVVDRAALRMLGVTPGQFERLVAAERVELDRRVRRYRGDRALPAVEDRDVVVVDDGLATGVTAEAALRAIVPRQPRRLVLAVPVCAPDTAGRLERLAEVVCLLRPPDFRAVGLWYDRFPQMSDDDVLDLLARSSAPAGPKR